MEERDMLKTLIITAALAAATTTAATASPAQMSDAQYLSAVRCQALISSPILGKGDTAAIDSVVKAQGAGRIEAVFDRADEVRSDAARQVRHADATGRAALMAERNGLCQSWTSNGSSMAATSSQPSGAN
jgi:hypothetical protein